MEDRVEISAGELQRLLEIKLDEPNETVRMFDFVADQVRRNNISDGIRMDITDDMYFQIFPEGTFIIEYDEQATRISRENARTFLYAAYFLSEGLDNIATIVQRYGIKVSYRIGEKTLAFVPGDKVAQVTYA